jgi:hypothetical protein
MQSNVVEKKFKTKQRLGYRLLDDKPLPIDLEVEYYIKCLSPACENRPVIARCDGQSYKGNDSWIVDLHNLVEIQSK